MIKVVAKRYLKADTIDAYLCLAKELVDFSRREEGCIDYELYYQEKDNLAVMIETWTDRYSLDCHLKNITAQGWPDKLNFYADPKRSGGSEIYHKLY